jgi:uncharacterized protein
MPQYLHPGVYIEEIERGPRPIEGVATSIAAFLGEAERGPLEPTLVTSYKDYQRWFGDVYARDKFLPYSINGFFENGGKSVYVCRLVGQAATTAQAPFGNAFSVRAAGAGEWGRRVFVRIDDSTTLGSDGAAIGFRIRLAYWSAAPNFQPLDPFDPANDGQRKPQHTEDFNDLVSDEIPPISTASASRSSTLRKATRRKGQTARPWVFWSAISVRPTGRGRRTTPLC